MAQIRIKRTAETPSDTRLLPGELALAGTTLYYGKKETGDGDNGLVSSMKVATQNGSNYFEGDSNTFKNRPKVGTTEVMLKGDIAAAKTLTIKQQNQNQTSFDHTITYDTSADKDVNVHTLSVIGLDNTSTAYYRPLMSSSTFILRDLGVASQSEVETAQTAANNAQNKADQAYTLAASSTFSYSFATKSAMTSALKSADNKKYKVGDNLFIEDPNVPDYWISGVLANNTGTYGYYQISELEVNLTGCVKLQSTAEQVIKSNIKIDTDYRLSFDGTDGKRPYAHNKSGGIYAGNGNEVLLRGEYPIQDIEITLSSGDITDEGNYSITLNDGQSWQVGDGTNDLVVSNETNGTKVVLPTNTYVGTTPLSDFGGAIKSISLNGGAAISPTDGTVTLPFINTSAPTTLVTGGGVATTWNRNQGSGNNGLSLTIGTIDCGTWS